MRQQGKVQWFNSKKGYGFVKPDNGDKDVFIHISELEKIGKRFVKEGQTLSYEVSENHGKSSAINIEVQD